MTWRALVLGRTAGEDAAGRAWSDGWEVKEGKWVKLKEKDGWVGTAEDEEEDETMAPHGVVVRARRRVTCEEDVFALLGLPYKRPTDRDCPS